jgi:hypothetical protein
LVAVTEGETTPVDIVSRRFRRYFSHWDSDKRQHVSYAKTVAEQFTSQCCLKCGCRTKRFTNASSQT